jgi:hypothetical protein
MLAKRVWRGSAFLMRSSRHSALQRKKGAFMNSKPIYETPAQSGTATAKSRKLMRQAIRLAVVSLLAATAYAQYGPGGGVAGTPMGSGTYAPGTPGYGHGAAIGAGVGAAVVGVGAVYFLTHRASKVTGCVETADDGLRLTDDKTRKTLSLVPGSANVTSGERVELKGKIKKNAAGDQSFLVKTVAKDFGQCRTQASVGAVRAFNPQAK